MSAEDASSSMREAKILTDIEIRQSPTWCEKTDYLGELFSRSTWPEKIGKSLGGILSPLIQVINVLRHQHKYDVIIHSNIRAAQLYALYRSILRQKKPKHIILELMLDESGDSLLWKAKKVIQRFMFSSVDVVFVSSRHEVISYSERFNLPRDLFRFLPFHTNVIEPRALVGSENYILSAGKTGRDYATLAEAVKNIEMDFIIVSDKWNAEGIVFPDNAKVLYDISYSDYLSILYNCRLVVVPLRKLVKSTGQVVILEAMALGKPVIATETIGTIDYIESGVNGVLVPVGDSGALRNAILDLIEHPGKSSDLAWNALKAVKENYTFDRYTERILNAAKDLAKTMD